MPIDTPSLDVSRDLASDRGHRFDEIGRSADRVWTGHG